MQRAITQLELVPTSERHSGGAALAGAFTRLNREFPSLDLAWRECATETGAVVFDEESWTAPDVRLSSFDEVTDQELARGVRLVRVGGAGERLGQIALEVLTRYQRYIERTNQASRHLGFQLALARHRALHDLGEPPVRANYDHAIDTWHWMLRLDPNASLGAQLAAVFHDVERLASEANARLEHRAASYRIFKDAHARGGAVLALKAVGNAVDRATAQRMADLIAAHERPSDDPELRLLNDADALSFFSLNSSEFFDYFGAAHLERKVAYTLARMSDPARARLAEVRLRGEVATILAAHLGRRR